MLLLVLAHVDADHRPLVVEQEVGQRPRELGLADAGRAEEQERPDRTVRIGQTGAAAADRVRDGDHGFVLADHPLVQHLFEAQQLVHLAFHEPAHGHARPLAHDLGDVFLVDLFLQHLLIRLELVEMLRGLFDLALELGDQAVADLGGPLEVGLTLEFTSMVVELLLERADRADGFLLGLPVGHHRRLLLVEVGELVDSSAASRSLLAASVSLASATRSISSLADAALDDVDLGRHRVDLDAQLAGRLVDEVDGLVGQEPAGEVAVGQHGGGDERGVLDAHAVVHLVALLQPAQDRDRVFDRRLIDEHRLEAALERGVLLDVLAVLVERGRARRGAARRAPASA